MAQRAWVYWTWVIRLVSCWGGRPELPELRSSSYGYLNLRSTYEIKGRGEKEKLVPKVCRETVGDGWIWACTPKARRTSVWRSLDAPELHEGNGEG